MVPGFTMSMRTRPICINKFQEFVGDKGVTIQSKRLLEEMKVPLFGEMEDQKLKQGYNDDLVMSFGIGMYIRDTAFKFQQQRLDMAKASLNNIKQSIKLNIRWLWVRKRCMKTHIK